MILIGFNWQNLKFTFFGVSIVTLLVGGTLSYSYAQSPYNSGYDHGCDDAKISDTEDRYIEQEEKGPEYHTSAFMKGYHEGFDDCLSKSKDTEKKLSSGECYDKGYDTGKNGPFNEDVYDQCDKLDDSSGQNPYYAGFVNGCLVVNPEMSEEECEEAA